MNILVVNDDGITEKGFHLLVEAVLPFGEVYIVAPEYHQSGKSQALSLRTPIEVKDYGNLYGAKSALSTSGTPADCTRMAFMLHKEVNFDLVVSGINRGPNIGSDILHSGTVGAASEALLFGVPAIAVSSPHLNYPMAEKYTSKIIGHLIDKKLISSDYLLNINFPATRFEEPVGIGFTVQGKHYHEAVYDQIGDNTYVSSYKPLKITEDENSDVYAFHNGIISITPVIEIRSKLEITNKLNNQSELNEIIDCGKIK